VLLISIDSLRADHVGAYGYRSPTRRDLSTTPNLDRLVAAEGVLFEQAISTTSWTLPAHVNLLSGLCDQNHGVRDLPQRIPADVVLLAQRFASGGYRTFGAWSGPNLHPFFGFGRGFDTYADCSEGFGAAEETLAAGDPAALRALQIASHRAVTGPALVGAFRGELGALHAEQPWFGFLPFRDVHYDYLRPAEHDLFHPRYLGPELGLEFHRLSDAPPSEEERLRWLSLYDAEIHATDEHIETLLAARAAGERGRGLLLAVCSDHGEEFGEHLRYGHRWTLFEEVLRVPLLRRYPGVLPAGLRVPQLVSLIDGAPTLLALAGVPVEGTAMDGQDLTPLLQGAAGRPRELPIELSLGAFGLTQLGMRAEAFEYTEDRPSGRRSLYDLRKDPAEQGPSHPPKLGSGRPDSDPRAARGARFVADLEAHAAELARVRAAADDGPLPEGLRSALEAAGYLAPEQAQPAPRDAEPKQD
jgi:arylsulfatase A-like enzyme